MAVNYDAYDTPGKMQAVLDDGTIKYNEAAMYMGKTMLDHMNAMNVIDIAKQDNKNSDNERKVMHTQRHSTKHMMSTTPILTVTMNISQWML